MLRTEPKRESGRPTKVSTTIRIDPDLLEAFKAGGPGWQSHAFESRLPAWQALSEFWLDTELQTFEIEHIAKVLAASPYSLEQIVEIHRYEVAPALWANAFSVAGVWSGFDTQWLMARCAANALARDNYWHRVKVWLQGPVFRSNTQSYWQQMLPDFKAARNAAALQGAPFASHC